jgi:myosin heavy subunit
MDLLSGFLIKPESYDLSTRSFKACMPHDSSKRHQFSVEEFDYFHPAESSITKQTQELKSKDDGIQKLEKLIEEKSKKIATLQSEITSLETKRSLAAEEQAGKANARAIELEKQIEKLKKDIEAQNSKKSTVEARAGDADKKVQELNAKLEKLQKTSDEQKRRIQKTEHALKVAEEELMRVQLETTTQLNQLKEVHGAWLPPWLVTHTARAKEMMLSHWNEHGKPAVNSLLQKASEKSVQAKKWAEPHVEAAKTKWIPVIKEKWVTMKTNAEPYVQKVSAKSIELYQASKDVVLPHVVKAHKIADPYFQEAKKVSKPYIDQVAKATKPHVEKIRIYLKPYTKRAVHIYGNFLEKATAYHQQAQATVLDYLHQHELTKEFATEELAWYLASALLIMPIYVFYNVLVETFCSKKKKKATRNVNANHGHRKHKRRHADK